MPWFIPRTQLDTVEQQPFLQKVSESPNTNIWLRGFAGSGKSVLLLHCLIDEKQKNAESKVIIVLYTYSLIDMIGEGIPNDYNNTRVVTFYQFRQLNGPFDLILIDEIQDIPEHDLREINAKRSTNGRVIVAGDINQSIYDHSPPVGAIANILTPLEYTLFRIYRLSQRIRKISADYCDDKVNYLAAQVMDFNTNVPVTLVNADDVDEEFKWLWFSAEEYRAAGYVPAILISNHEKIIKFISSVLIHTNKPPLNKTWLSRSDRDYDAINNHLQNNNINLQYLGNNFGSFEEAHSKNLISVMTYHSSKGLDFKTIFIPLLSMGYQIWGDADRAKTLFFVALTRSREQLILSYSGKMAHPFLTKSITNECQLKSAKEELSRIENPFGGINNNEDIVVI